MPRRLSIPESTAPLRFLTTLPQDGCANYDTGHIQQLFSDQSAGLGYEQTHDAPVAVDGQII
jgi:hypothetical protein